MLCGARSIGGQIGDARAGLAHRKRERATFVQAQLMQHRNLVEPEVVGRCVKERHFGRQIDGHAIGGGHFRAELTGQRVGGAQMQIAARQTLRKERQQALRIGQRDSAWGCLCRVRLHGRCSGSTGHSGGARLRSVRCHRCHQGRITSMIAATASCTCASSLTAREMATSHARRGAMPPTTSCAV